MSMRRPSNIRCVIVCLCLTWVLQHVQFFTESIIVILQLSLLLLHVLHVLCERANLRLMLLKDTKILTWTTHHLRASERLIYWWPDENEARPVRWAAGRRTALGWFPPSCDGTPAACSPAACSASPSTSPQTWSYWCTAAPRWTPPRSHRWSPPATHRHRDYRDTQLQLKESELL